MFFIIIYEGNLNWIKGSCLIKIEFIISKPFGYKMDRAKFLIHYLDHYNRKTIKILRHRKF